MQAQSLGPFVKFLFRNLPNISLYIYTHHHHMGFVAKESHAHSVGLWAVQRSRYLERLLLFCRKMQRPTQCITYSTTLTESAGPARRNDALCTWAGGQAFGGGHVPLTSQVRHDHPQRPRQVSADYRCCALCFAFGKG